ncbi:hypothetical protein H696_03498 [Fonticula alba]|uniref:Uncharacterized protein n=1 Tax=Fonticula alba TaxID=691883 RepID=A0A058Z954_FONAL|nr:hypothetical protein H696_03498 [Fonticula alba]KCV70032.1 hypothetical protein H696_03498 [Fonticula alba]|eukprot:XP_009495638.1 hypothetical protein H696_03498 [Fonticula alba]
MLSAVPRPSTSSPGPAVDWTRSREPGAPSPAPVPAPAPASPPPACPRVVRAGASTWRGRFM